MHQRSPALQGSPQASRDPIPKRHSVLLIVRTNATTLADGYDSAGHCQKLAGRLSR